MGAQNQSTHKESSPIASNTLGTSTTTTMKSLKNKDNSEIEKGTAENQRCKIELSVTKSNELNPTKCVKDKQTKEKSL